MSRVIGVLSGKGGVGKTSVAANLVTALRNDFNRRAVAVDANPKSPHLGLHIKSGDGVAARGGRSAKSLRSEARRLSGEYDIVILDIPPGLGKEAVTSISAADAGLIVTNPDFPSVVAALKSAHLMEKMRKDVLGIVVNNRGGGSHELSDREIESICGRSVIATIPADRRVPEGISEGVPAVSRSPSSGASVAFKQLAGLLVDEAYRPANVVEKIRMLVSRMRR